MELKRVVITGLGAITPIGNTVSEFWDALCKGVNGAGEITRFDCTKFKTRIACEVKNYDPQQFFDRKEARKLDLYTQFALIASERGCHGCFFVQTTRFTGKINFFAFLKVIGPDIPKTKFNLIYSFAISFSPP